MKRRLALYAGGLHEARARTFPPASTLSQRRRLEVAAQRVTKRVRRRRRERGDLKEGGRKKKKICRANSRAR